MSCKTAFALDVVCTRYALFKAHEIKKIKKGD